MTATIDLLDANVWVALSIPTHVHHERALQYYNDESAPVLAFCRVTGLAFLRHLMNRAIADDSVLDAQGAWDRYQRWLQIPGVTFLPEPAALDLCLQRFCQGVLGYREVSDAYLASLAIVADCRFVSFDRGFSRYAGLDLLHLVA